MVSHVVMGGIWRWEFCGRECFELSETSLELFFLFFMFLFDNLDNLRDTPAISTRFLIYFELYFEHIRLLIVFFSLCLLH